MSDSYQAIYDAVRSKISNGDAGHAIQEVAARAFDISHITPHLQQEIYSVSFAMQRPSVLYRPVLSADGDVWCALYGDNLQSGVAGFGKTAADAMAAFDQAWFKEQTPAAIRIAREDHAREQSDNSQFGVGV